jgi:AraC-like DNA-binding protein
VDDFLASLRVVELGPLQVCTMSLPEMESIRSPKLIRRSDPELYQVAMFEHGDYWFARPGHEARLNPGNLMICDSSRPFRARIKPVEAAMCVMTVVQFPRAMCPLGLDDISRLVGYQLSGQTGIGAVLSDHLRGLARHASDLSGADSARLATITLDLLAAWCAHELGTQEALPQQTRHRVLITRIHDHIGRHLADPDLSPATIAQAHHISVRHLHNLFQMQGLTVAGWIRHRRLERCRHDLSDPRLSNRPIHALAARWGFTDNAHFSRVFRRAYNMSPTECRASAISQALGAHRQ